MPIYTGDESGIRKFEGMHVSPNGHYWGSEPITEAMEREWLIRDGKIKPNRRDRRALKFKGRLDNLD